MKIKFTRDYTVKNKDAAHYEEDKTYEMGDASANHFINRRAAVEVGGKSAPVPVAAPVVPPVAVKKPLDKK